MMRALAFVGALNLLTVAAVFAAAAFSAAQSPRTGGRNGRATDRRVGGRVSRRTGGAPPPQSTDGAQERRAPALYPEHGREPRPRGLTLWELAHFCDPYEDVRHDDVAMGRRMEALYHAHHDLEAAVDRVKGRAA